MTDHPEDSGQTVLDMADRKMLAEIKANVLGTSRVDLRIGRFRVLERLGEGSMGIVFAAVDDQLQRRVAIKLLHQAVGASEDERKARLFREAQILAQLQHPNIVQVYEVGEHDGQVFMAMELVDGQRLDELQRDRPQTPWRTLVQLYVTAGRGLAAAHAQGVVHRDFKPHNVLIDSMGRVCVVDFGLARESTGAERQYTAEIPVIHGGAIERPPGAQLTATGAVPGTPAYMAPELFDGQPASPASDQFSFCVALYEAVYGRRPFEGGRVKELVDAAQHGRILPPLADRQAPRWLFEVLTRGLAATPEARYPSMEVLLAELERDRALRWKRAGVFLAVAVAIVGAWWTRGHSERVVDAQALLTHPLLEEGRQRREECRSQTAVLEESWRDAKDHFVRSTFEREDVDGPVAILEADAERFFERWEGTCLSDLDGSTQPCRARAGQAFEALIELASHRSLHVDALHGLTYSLELCLEEGEWRPSDSFGSESPARQALIDAEAAELAGQLDDALQHLDRAVGLAERTEQLTWARALLQQGAILESRGELEKARPILKQAWISAVIGDADVLAIDAALASAKTEILHHGSADLAEESLGIAGRLLKKPTTPEVPLRRARLLEKQGNAQLNFERRCVEGLLLLQQALAIREHVIEDQRSHGLPTALVERLAADTQLNIANAKYLALTGYWGSCALPGLSEARVIDDYQQARARFARAVGNDRHLGLAEYEFGLGAALMLGRRYAEAIVHLEAAHAIHGAYHGFDSIPVGDDHLALAEAYRQADDITSALRHARKNVEIRRNHLGGEGQRLTLAAAHSGLGVIAQDAGRLDLARQAILDSIDVLTTPSASGSTLEEREHLRMAYVNLALVELDRDDWEAAGRAIERARRIQAELRQDDIAPQRLAEATLWFEQGKTHRAIEHLEGVERLPDATAKVLALVADLRARANGTK